MENIKILSGKNIENIRLHNYTDTIKITFDWPRGITEVYVFKITGNQIFTLTPAAIPQGQLLTYQEYIRNSGYVAQKTYTKSTYYIYPTTNFAGEKSIYDQPGTHIITHTAPTQISVKIIEKNIPLTQYKNCHIHIRSQHTIPPNIIHIKKSNTTYPILDEIHKNLTLIMRVPQADTIQPLISDQAKSDKNFNEMGIVYELV